MIGILAAAAMLPVPGLIELPDHAIRLHDLAPAAARGNLVIARIPAGRSSLTLSSAALNRLLARAMPSIGRLLPIGHYTFTIRKSHGSGMSCWQAQKNISAGHPIGMDDVAAAACEPHTVLPDAVKTLCGLPIARRAIPAGAPLGRLYVPVKAVALPGDALTLVTQTGPVTVERRVTLLQVGVPGRRVFVRDQAKNVISAMLKGERSQ